MTRCLYCGYRTRVNDRVCTRCSDLPRNDPYFAAGRKMGTTAAAKPRKPEAPKRARYDLELADTIEGERLRRGK